ncbi:glycerophosphoryl diester phosphodiesterase family protein [Yersinia intermedia]|nr:glycerophosphoryl diester phosphodiesterase family protein [Yersinia intermedia]
MKRNRFYFIYLLLTLCISPLSASPLIVAHRAGTADFPENTRYAISKALSNDADIIWVSVQLSKDGVLVLYRPKDLSELTDGSGLVSDHSWEELQLLDAAYHFKSNDQYVFRGWGVKIPLITSYVIIIPTSKIHY